VVEQGRREDARAGSAIRQDDVLAAQTYHMRSGSRGRVGRKLALLDRAALRRGIRSDPFADGAMVERAGALDADRRERVGEIVTGHDTAGRFHMAGLIQELRGQASIETDDV